MPLGLGPYRCRNAKGLFLCHILAEFKDSAELC